MQSQTRRQLTDALARSAEAAQRGWELASQHLDDTERALDQAERSIQESLEAIRGSRVRTGELTAQLERALVELHMQLRRACRETELHVEHLHERLGVFSVTLFGRTMAGKSTLMEILTCGEGGSIGQGAQRTTRDVRAYTWNGLEIIDVPGVAAFEGQEDERVAFEAAAQADLVLFLITDDAPQPVEAEILARVRRMGKNVLGVCNVKQGIDSEAELRRFLRNPERAFDPARLAALIGQFMEMAQLDAPGLRVDFLPTHLRARFLAQRPSHAPWCDKLTAASRFDAVEERLAAEIIRTGPLRRTQTFLDAVSLPMQALIERLIRDSADHLSHAALYRDKRDEQDRWAARFVENARRRIPADLKRHIDALRAEIPGFAEQWLEQEGINDAWTALQNKANLPGKAELILKSLQTEAETHVKALMEELEMQLKFTAKLQQGAELKAASINDYRRWAGWGGVAVGGAGVIIGLFVVSGPIGWVIGAGTVVLGLLTWIFDKRDVRVRDARLKLEKQLHEHLGKIEVELNKQLLAAFEEQLHEGLLGKVRDQLTLLVEDIDRQAATLMVLARGLLPSLRGIHVELLRAACLHLQVEPLEVRACARVPGVVTFVVVSQEQRARAQLYAPRLEALLGEGVLISIAEEPRALIAQVLGGGISAAAITLDEARHVARVVTASSPSPDLLSLACQLTGLYIQIVPTT